jgi:methylmalonyl-CoA/ethylmalonyl-CoA epimerase
MQPNTAPAVVDWSESELTRMEEFEFHHFGVAVRKLEQAIPVFGHLFGYKLTSGQFDDPIQNVSVCFLSRGDQDPVLELVAPLGPNSPIDRTLKKGGGIYHICYRVPDIRGAIAHLTGLGSFLLSGPVPAVAFGMREIAWLMTEADLLVELLEGSGNSRP